MGEVKERIKRSRDGCHECKRLKVKCDEKKPSCSYCVKRQINCDYTKTLTWGGRPYKNADKKIKGSNFGVLATKSAVPKTSTGPDSKKRKVFSDLPKQIIFKETTVGDVRIGASKDREKLKERDRDMQNSTPMMKASSESAVTYNVSANAMQTLLVNSISLNGSNLMSFNSPQEESLLNNYGMDSSNKPKSTSSMPPPSTENSANINNNNINNINPTTDNNNTNNENNDNNSITTTISNVHKLANNGLNDGDNDKDRYRNSLSVLDQIPQISDGIESLSQALESIASGGNQFNIRNSEIFNNFVLSNLDDKKGIDDLSFFANSDMPNYNPKIDNKSTSNSITPLNSMLSMTPIAGISASAWDLDDLLTDMLKIENVFGNKPSTYIDEVLSPASVLSSFSRRHPQSHYQVKEAQTPTTQLQTQLLKSHHAQLQTQSESPHLPSSSSAVVAEQQEKLLFKQLLDPLNAFDSVPPPLTPFPELLLRVPYYRELFHFWINVASDHLVPAPSTVYHENPFKVILPRMAMESPSILTTLLAFAASVSSQYSFSVHESKGIIDQLLSRSCTELLKLLQDKQKATSNATLATVLLLSCLEVFGSGNIERHRAHTLGARQIILSRGLKLPTNQKIRDISHEDDNNSVHSGSISTTTNNTNTRNNGTKSIIKQETLISDVLSPSLVTTEENDGTSESNVTYFLMRWFAYVDVIGALSATKKSENYLCHLREDDFYHDTSNLQIERSGHIDRLLGFDLIFLPLFADIALLLRQTNSYLLSEGSRQDTIPIHIITKALEIKETMTAAFESGENRRKLRLEEAIRKRKDNGVISPSAGIQKIIEKDNVLRSTNKIFFNMGLLNLYRRTLKIERRSPVVQDLCEEIGDILQLNIEPKSAAEICSIFCTFCAACESTDRKMQHLFHARFTLLAEMGLRNAARSLEIMERCWATGEDWMHVANVLDIDITLL